MNPGHKVGLRRLAIALLVPWFIAWGTVLTFNYIAAADAQTYGDQLQALGRDAIAADRAESVSDEYFRSAIAVYGRRDTAKKWERRAAIIGLSVPVAGFAAILLAFWVWRGFRPRRISN